MSAESPTESKYYKNDIKLEIKPQHLNYIKVFRKSYSLTKQLKIFFSSPEDMLSLVLEREDGREEGIQEQRETLMRERSMRRLPPIHSQTRDHTRPDLG